MLVGEPIKDMPLLKDGELLKASTKVQKSLIFHFLKAPIG